MRLTLPVRLVNMPALQRLIAIAVLRGRSVQMLGWMGSLTGIIGAGMLAANRPWSGFGWFWFLASNLAWIAFALVHHIRSQLVMQLAFLATTLLGIYRFFM